MSDRALIQRPRRKMHLASRLNGSTDYLTFCDYVVTAFGTDVHPYSATEPTQRLVTELHAITKGKDLCAYCARSILLIELLMLDRTEYGKASL